MIYRSDDLPQEVTLDTLRKVQDLFNSHGKIHTMSILVSQLPKRRDFVEFVKDSEGVELALHGWEHVNYSEQPEDIIKEHLHKSLEMFDHFFGTYPDTWYLPWNGWVKGKGFSLVPRVRKIAKSFGLTVNEVSEHIGAVIKKEVKTDVVYFHLWDKNDVKLLPKLLEMP